MTSVYHNITLSLTDFNNVGDLKVRQADDESQVLDVTVIENGVIKSFNGLTPFFCLMAREVTGQGISEEPVLNYNAINGKLQYTLSANAMQMVGRNEAYFSFRKELSNGEWIEQFSTRSFFYIVEKSIYTQPFKDSNYWFTFKELYKKFIDYQDSGKKSWEDFVESNREIIESVDPGGVVLTNIIDFRHSDMLDITFDSMKLRGDFWDNELRGRGISPMWFGAVGDGVTDDGPALKETHEFANLTGLNVVYPSDKQFYVSEVENIEIKTNVDFSNCRIIINENPSTADTKVPLFLVTGDETIQFENDATTSGIAVKLQKANPEVLTELANGKNRYVEVYDDNELIFSRKGYETGPEAKRDIFVIDGKGNILSELTHDYQTVTRIVVKTIQERIQIKNGRFKGVNGLTEGPGRYVWRNLTIERSNVMVENIQHTADDWKGKKNSIGFIYTRNCSGIDVKNCQLQVLKSTGSYSIANYMTLDITLDNLQAQSKDSDSWGAHVSYFAKNLSVLNSKINRIDSHGPIHNLTIIKSEIGSKGVTVTGFGKLTIKDSIFLSDAVVNLREDFGSFWNGNILIENIEHFPATNYPKLFNIFPSVDFDFGIKPYFGKDFVRVSNYTIHDHDATATPILMRINGEYSASVIKARDWFYLSQEFSFSNIKCTSGRGVLPIYTTIFRYLRSDFGSFYSEHDETSISIRSNTVFNLRNIRLDGPDSFFSASSSNISNLIRPMGSEFSYETTSAYTNFHIAPKFNIERCNPLYASFRGMRAELNVKDCLINSFMNLEGGGSQLVATLENCAIEPRFLSTQSPKYMIRTERKRTIFINCRFRLPVNETGKVATSSADFLSVYTIFSGVTHQTNINFTAALSNCKFEDVFNFKQLNSAWDDFEADVGNAVDTIYRKSGTTAQRPYGSKRAQTFYDTTLNKLMVYNGTSWV